MSDRDSRSDLGLLTVPGDPANGIRKAVEDFLRHMALRNYSPLTIEIRRLHLVEFIEWAVDERGFRSVDEITRTELEQYRAWLSNRPMKHGGPRAMSTQGVRITSVRVFFRFLVVSGQIEVNPALYFERPRQERLLRAPAFTSAEIELILHQPDITKRLGIRDRAIMEVLFATGIRRRELIYLRIGDVDYSAKVLRVRRGKGGKGRVVPISDRALGWIRWYLRVRPVPLDAADADVLFLTKYREMLGATSLCRTVTQHVRAAGITKTGSCHMFRASMATLMLEGGADLRFIQEMLGHSKIETTQIYTRVSAGSLQRIYQSVHPSARQAGSPVA